MYDGMGTVLFSIYRQLLQFLIRRLVFYRHVKTRSFMHGSNWKAFSHGNPGWCFYARVNMKYNSISRCVSGQSHRGGGPLLTCICCYCFVRLPKLRGKKKRVSPHKIEGCLLCVAMKKLVLQKLFGALSILTYRKVFSLVLGCYKVHPKDIGSNLNEQLWSFTRVECEGVQACLAEYLSPTIWVGPSATEILAN